MIHDNHCERHTLCLDDCDCEKREMKTKRIPCTCHLCTMEPQYHDILTCTCRGHCLMCKNGFVCYADHGYEPKKMGVNSAAIFNALKP
jgi:hypothetical protein